MFRNITSSSVTKTPRKPSSQEVRRYLKRWDSLENYMLQESSLKKLFTKTYPSNSKMDDVLIKVCALNDFYSTNIFSPFTVAKHIVSLGIDKQLTKGDLSIVNKISRVVMPGGSIINFYSFATKYCSHHYPKVYPIYDSYVDKILMYFRNKDHFHQFSREELKTYSKFRNVLMQFRKHYGLQQFNLKQIDKYLWQLGKRNFPRKY
ncbi:MAG: hypothetical protein ABIG34_03280 [Candidatus Peregrinibacteria bacterium]